MFRSHVFVLLTALVTFAPSLAAAQSRVLVLPWSLTDGDAATLAARAEGVVGAFSTGEGTPIAIADARARFEADGSGEPPSMSDSDLDHWLALSRQAVHQLAAADYAAAAATLREAQSLSEPAAAELNRQESRARQVLDTCLYEVRGLVETEDPRASERALECRRLVPRIAPSPYQHTPEVVELLQRIDARLAAAPPGSLRIESSPTGCRVRLNGIPLGETPFVSEDLATGEYRAQVECGEEATGQRGRVHRIRLGEGASTVRIDLRFDAAVRTDTALRLVYATQDDADAHRLDDALTAANLVGAGEVWLVAIDPTDPEIIRIDRVRVATSSVLASIRTHTATGLAASVVAVQRGGAEDRTGATVTPMALWGANGAVSHDEGARPHATLASRADWEIGLGIGLGVAGIAGYVTSFVLVSSEMGFGHLATQPLITDPDYRSRRAAWTNSELPVLISGWAGGALTTLALPFLMSNEEGTPWWSWVIGGVGVATVVTGVVLAATTSTCTAMDRPTDACVQSVALVDQGSTIASMGAPLVAVPIVYLLREAVGGAPPVTPSVSVSSTGASLSLGGAW